MKYMIILGDGMADEAIPSFGGLTPLQAAHKPEMDFLAKEGTNGLMYTIPEGFSPGSEIANMAILGYDLEKVYEGRGSLEAASMGIGIEPGEMAMRCNFICIEDGRIKNHSGGQISTEESSVLIEFLQKELGGPDVNFFTGVSYRHLLKLKGGNKGVIATPPHDIIGRNYMDYLPKSPEPQTDETEERLTWLIRKSMEILPGHPINIARAQRGEDMANSIWPWSPGYRPMMEPLSARYAAIRNGSVISAVDLIKGIGVYAGLTPVAVDGATGLYDTNYEGKAEAALKALRQEDFVFLHIEASDEAGHDGDPELKLKTIENLNDRIVRPVLRGIRDIGEDVTIAVLPDHPTPCSIRTHTAAPVPFTIYRTNAAAMDDVSAFDEESAKKGYYGSITAKDFMGILLQDKR